MFVQGILIYNDGISRPDIMFSNGRLLGGLHCGNCLEIEWSGYPSHTRLELLEDWVLVFGEDLFPLPYGAPVKLME